MNCFFHKILLFGCILFSIGSVEVSSPTLVVFIVIDQMREDTFERFEDLFTGGLKYLYNEGVYFSETRHAFSYSATGPGHFALASGRHPGSGGIVANSWYSRELKREIYCIEDEETSPVTGQIKPVSYRNVQLTTLGDWLKSADNLSKVFSIAIKDRAAVLMGGKHPDGAFWFDFDTGIFNSTTYYMDYFPQWLNQFNAKHHVDSYFGTDWDRLLNDESIYLKKSREDDFKKEEKWEGSGDATFPHHLSRPVEQQKPEYDLLWDYPWLDHITLSLAEEVIVSESLGKDSYMDLLSIGLTMADGVGHHFGPFSQEVMDTFLRLDRKLGEFFNFVDETVGLDKTLIVFSADHGSTMMPEFAKRLDMDVKRFGSRYGNTRKEYNAILSERWGEASYIEALVGGSFYYNHETLESKGITIKQMDEVLIPLLKEEFWLAKVYKRKELASDSSLDYLGAMWRNNFHPENSGDLFIVPRKGYTYSDPVGAGHGTPYDQDTHVPLIFAGNGLVASTIDDSVQTVDVAPTVAHYLGIPIPIEVDGKVLTLIPAQGATTGQE